MSQTKVLAESYSFTPSALLELWTLDGTAIGLSTIYRFVNGSNCNYQPITFNGVQYLPFPIMIEGMEMDGKGGLPRPKLTVSNINGYVSALLLSNTSSLDGATVTRKRVFARFIDSSNFPVGQPLPSWVTPDPTAAFPDESFVINRKIAENPQIVQFELASPLEANNIKLPRRQIIANVCLWKYRQLGTCNYSGVPVADSANREFTGSYYGMTLVDRGAYSSATTYNRGDYVTIYSDLPQFSAIPVVWVCATNGTNNVAPSSTASNWVADSCTKSCASCKLRFTDTPLRTSAMPGVSRADWVLQRR